MKKEVLHYPEFKLNELQRPLYNELLSIYEKNANRTLAQSEKEYLVFLAKNKVSSELFAEAMRRAILAERKCDLYYIKAVMEKWENDGILSLKELKEHDKKRELKTTNTKCIIYTKNEKSMVAYINLHPTYDYAVAIVKGYIPYLKDYVRLVDWLSWHKDKKGLWQILISGGIGIGETEEIIQRHIKRTYILIQRLQSVGALVKLRDERTDSFLDFELSQKMSEQEMLREEADENLNKQKEIYAIWNIPDIEEFGDLDFPHGEDGK